MIRHFFRKLPGAALLAGLSFIIHAPAAQAAPIQTSLQPNPVQATDDDWECPESLSVSLDIGALSVDGHSDADFESYSGTEIRFRFKRAPHPEECLLTQEGLEQTVRRASLVIRRPRAGGLEALLEGYTHTGKLYSAQSRLDLTVTQDWTGKFDGYFYDASGSMRRRLGEASVTLAPDDGNER